MNIYYNGGNLAKVNSENSVEFDEFYFYTDTKSVPKEIIKNNYEEDLFLDIQNGVLMSNRIVDNRGKSGIDEIPKFVDDD